MSTTIENNNNNANENVAVAAVVEQHVDNENMQEIKSIQATISAEMNKLKQLVKQQQQKNKSTVAPKKVIGKKAQRQSRMSKAKIESIVRKFLGGKLIRDYSYMEQLKMRGGIVVTDINMETFEATIRAFFTRETGDKCEKFDEVFDFFFVASRNGQNKYDAVLAYKTRGGSNDSEQRLTISTWASNDEAFETTFERKPMSMSDYRRKIGIARERTTSNSTSDAEASTSSSNDDEMSSTIIPISTLTDNEIVVQSTPLDTVEHDVDDNDDNSVDEDEDSELSGSVDMEQC